MKVRTYIIDDQKRLCLTPSEEVRRSAEFDAPLWVDVEGGDIKEREAWMSKLNLHGLTQRLCLEAADRPGFYPLHSEIVLVLPVLTTVSGTQAFGHLCVACHDRLLLTVHDLPMGSEERLCDIDYAEAWLADRSGPALLSAILIDISTEYLSCVQTLRELVTGLEARMDKDPNDVTADEIMNLRGELLTVAAAVGDAMPVVAALAASDGAVSGKGTARDFLKCAVVNLKAADGQLDWLDGRMSDLRSRFELHAQEQTNRRLNMLTVLSAIFMPVTLMASIWGMNFASMPELAFPYAYPIGLIAMAVVASVMYLFFKRGGWFD